jgi:hypothetical protein
MVDRSPEVIRLISPSDSANLSYSSDDIEGSYSQEEVEDEGEE